MFFMEDKIITPLSVVAIGEATQTPTEFISIYREIVRGLPAEGAIPVTPLGHASLRSVATQLRQASWKEKIAISLRKREADVLVWRRRPRGAHVAR